MLAISLTTIPPRYGQLARVLDALCAQGADRVVVTVPRRYRRFASAPPPALPDGVDLVETETDLGPAGKLRAAAAALPGADILYCDDDWVYGPGWADTFIRERERHGSDCVIAGSTWSTSRIGRQGGTIAQGFAGVLVPGRWARHLPPPPPAAWAADDIWLSGGFAGLGLGIVEAPGARALCRPLDSPGALQDTTDRDADNRRAAALVHEAWGTWPEV